jgi:hypothetical protein
LDPKSRYNLYQEFMMLSRFNKNKKKWQKTRQSFIYIFYVYTHHWMGDKGKKILNSQKEKGRRMYE